MTLPVTFETMSDAALLRAAIDASGLSSRSFAEWLMSRDERTVRRWNAGEPLPETARTQLRWFLSLSDSQRTRLVAILRKGRE